MASVRLSTFSLVKTLRRCLLEAADESAGTNTHSAPRRHAPRRPCCSLCSARARSGLRTTHARVLPLALGSVAPPLPPAPVPLLRNRSVSLRQLPTEATVTITLT